MDELSRDDLIRRLEAVEAALRRLKWRYRIRVVVALILIAGLWAWFIRHESYYKEVSAVRIVLAKEGHVLGEMGSTAEGFSGVRLVDPRGRLRLIAGLEERGDELVPVLAYRDDRGRERIALKTDDWNNPSLSLAGPGKSSLQLSVNARGEPVVWLGAGRGEAGLRLTAAPDGSSRLQLLGENSAERVGLELDREGSAAARVKDRLGSAHAEIRFDSEGDSGLFVRDLNELTRTGLRLPPGGSPTLVLSDPNRKARLKIETSDANRTALELRNQNGENRAILEVREDGRPAVRLEQNDRTRLLEIPDDSRP